MGCSWPPVGIDPVNPFELPLLNTVILLSSGATITWSHHSLIGLDRKGALWGAFLTVILAMIFSGFQAVEYYQSSFTISDGVFGSCFFFATGFHGYNRNYPCNINNYLNSTLNLYKGDLILLKAVLVNKRPYSTMFINVKESGLSPYWVTGFADAESSFSLKVSKKSTSKSGWGFVPEFRIELHSRDLLLLRKIQSFFGVGIISERKDKNIVVYSIQSIRDIIEVIIPHFDRYPLITQKKADYLLFKQAIVLLNLKLQSNIEGVRQIISIKASMNSGLSEKLKMEFPTILPIPRPQVSAEDISDYNWLAGFVDGEGCFYVKVTKSKSHLTGFKVSISFSISQHVRDELLLKKFIEYLGCGVIEKVSTRPNAVTFVVYKFGDILGKIIPLFQGYPLQGVKHMDYKDFVTVANLMENKSHLTLEGLKKIKSLKSGMNIGRT
jgi:hypothetical protein